jgi:hypothetical protein
MHAFSYKVVLNRLELIKKSQMGGRKNLPEPDQLLGGGGGGGRRFLVVVRGWGRGA